MPPKGKRSSNGSASADPKRARKSSEGISEETVLAGKCIDTIRVLAAGNVVNVY